MKGKSMLSKIILRGSSAGIIFAIVRSAKEG
jgi:hypothetical protein